MDHKFQDKIKKTFSHHSITVYMRKHLLHCCGHRWVPSKPHPPPLITTIPSLSPSKITSNMKKTIIIK